MEDGLWPSARWEGALGDPLTAEVIWSRVAEGETLAEVCRSRGWPRSMVVRWIEGDAGRRAAYEFALRVWADGLAQECVGIARTPEKGVVRKIKGDGTEEVTEEDMLGHRKLKIDTFMRMAGKWDRERYGERTEGVTTGLVQINIGIPEAVVEVAPPVERVVQHASQHEEI